MTGTSMGAIIWARGALEALREVSRTIDGALCEAEAVASGASLPGEAARHTERVRGLQEAQLLVDVMVERARERVARAGAEEVAEVDGGAVHPLEPER